MEAKPWPIPGRPSESRLLLSRGFQEILIRAGRSLASKSRHFGPLELRAQPEEITAVFEQLIILMKQPIRQHYGAERQESGDAKAERLVREELAKKGCSEVDLSRPPKDDPGKVRIARRLRTETTMTLAFGSPYACRWGFGRTQHGGSADRQHECPGWLVVTPWRPCADRQVC